MKTAGEMDKHSSYSYMCFSWVLGCFL